MKRFLIFIFIISIFTASCVKDRIQPAAPVVNAPTGDTLMYYWSFNAGDSAVRTPDFGVHTNANFSYYCGYIDFTGGSNLNLYGAEDSGQCLRVRNPTDSIVFHMPTTGYDSITLSFVEEASSTTSGSTINAIYYTTDGVNYISTALGNNSYNIGLTFALFTFNFSTDPNVNNNPKFAIKIVPLNNNTGTSGNDRFDNISLLGVRQ